MCALGCSGCYYGHLAVGQARILWAQRPVSEVLADRETPEELRHQLELVGHARAFAVELGLEVKGQYTSYVPWPGDRIVTTVVATAPGAVEAAGYRFPIVGRVPYKGFFDPEKARRESDDLQSEGFDTCVVPVAAYSTLGWLDDPLTAPMLKRSADELVETVLHELVHANVYVPSQPEFNEGVAQFIGEEAALRFFRSHSGNGYPDAGSVLRRVEDDRLLGQRLLHFRDQVDALYSAQSQSPPPPPPDSEPGTRNGDGPGDRERERRALESQARIELAGLPLATRDAAPLAKRIRLNDACLALRGTYARDSQSHTALLESLGNDLAAFVARLRGVADSDDPRGEFFAPHVGPHLDP